LAGIGFEALAGIAAGLRRRNTRTAQVRPDPHAPGKRFHTGRAEQIVAAKRAAEWGWAKQTFNERADPRAALRGWVGDGPGVLGLTVRSV